MIYNGNGSERSRWHKSDVIADLISGSNVKVKVVCLADGADMVFPKGRSWHMLQLD